MNSPDRRTLATAPSVKTEMLIRRPVGSLASTPVTAPAGMSRFVRPVRRSTKKCRTQAPISIDGDLSDAAWQSATKYEVWYETTGGIGKHWTTVEVKVEDEIFYLYMKPAGATQYTLIGARTDRALTSGAS